MIDPKVLQKAEEIMKKANLPEMMEKPGGNDTPLGSWLGGNQPKPKK
jgi:hypothetical protein